MGHIVRMLFQNSATTTFLMKVYNTKTLVKALVLLKGADHSSLPVHRNEPQQQSRTFPSTLPTS